MWHKGVGSCHAWNTPTAREVQVPQVLPAQSLLMLLVPLLQVLCWGQQWPRCISLVAEQSRKLSVSLLDSSPHSLSLFHEKDRSEHSGILGVSVPVKR